MVNQDVFVEKTLLRLLEAKKYQSLRDILATMNPAAPPPPPPPPPPHLFHETHVLRVFVR